MLVTEIKAQFKEGTKFRHKGRSAVVTWVRPPYPPDYVKVEDPKTKKEKIVKIDDKSVGISFQIEETGEKIFLASMDNDFMVKEGKVFPLDLKDYEK